MSFPKNVDILLGKKEKKVMTNSLPRECTDIYTNVYPINVYFGWTYLFLVSYDFLLF